MERPWGVHHIGDVYHPDVQCGLPDGRHVAAVAEPYTANSLVAAWWVLTGRAYAMVWPKPGDIENILMRPPAPMNTEQVLNCKTCGGTGFLAPNYPCSLCDGVGLVRDPRASA